MNSKVIIIAEVGVNHNGSIDIAKKLIKSAKSAGADYVKFQTFSSDTLVTKKAQKANYQKINDTYNESQYEMLKRLEIDDSFHLEIYKYSQEIGIGFLSTGFTEEDIIYLTKFKMDFIKIPSGEITNYKYLKTACLYFKKIILSTGMANLNEIRNAINILKKEGIIEQNIYLLQCTSEYPAPYKNVNLNVIDTFKKEFETKIGYSDHTLGIEVSLAAVALGCKLIEKHLTLDKKFIGPDHLASIEPNEFNLLVKSIRNIEMSLGSKIKKPSKAEKENIKVVRKSLVAKIAIKKGEKYSSKNIACMRPGCGICASKYDNYLGKESKYNFNAGELIKD